MYLLILLVRVRKLIVISIYMIRRFLLLFVYELISQFMKNNVLKENKGILFLFESLFVLIFIFLIIQSIFDLMEKVE